MCRCCPRCAGRGCAVWPSGTAQRLPAAEKGSESVHLEHPSGGLRVQRVQQGDVHHAVDGHAHVQLEGTDCVAGPRAHETVSNTRIVTQDDQHLLGFENLGL